MDLPLTDWLDHTLYHNTLRDWAVALGAALIAVSLALLVRRLLARKLRATAATTATDWDDFLLAVVEKTRLLPLVVAGLALGSLWLELPPKTQGAVKTVFVLTFLVQATLWAAACIDFWVERYRRRRLETDAAAATTLVAMRFIGKLALYSVLLLLALDNVGVDVTALVAGLGVGGVAVALAVQNILGDLFASLSIVIDKPFVIGDFIVVGDYAGTVEYIGLKTTRLRSLSGEQLIFSNSDLLGSRVRNYKRMAERRILFGFGVVYQTPAEMLAEIPELVRGIIDRQEMARFDRAHFKTFGDSAFEFEVVYFVLSPEYAVYMNVQQAINLELLRELTARDVQFAYPTRTLFIERTAEANGAERTAEPEREAEPVSSAH
jgi:small-conductance mechanosensitive channel